MNMTLVYKYTHAHIFMKNIPMLHCLQELGPWALAIKQTTLCCLSVLSMGHYSSNNYFVFDLYDTSECDTRECLDGG